MIAVRVRVVSLLVLPLLALAGCGEDRPRGTFNEPEDFRPIPSDMPLPEAS